MRLRPYPQRLKRLEKVIRHYFNPGERWWQVIKQPFLDWHAQWRRMQSGGALVPEGWHLIVPGSPADDTATEAHEVWFAVAQAAYDAARKRGTVFSSERSNRKTYIGPAGVKVVATTDLPPALVTAYRVSLKGLSYLIEPERYEQTVLAQEEAKGRAADRASERAAVRRAGLYASLLNVEPAGDQEER